MKKVSCLTVALLAALTASAQAATVIETREGGEDEGLSTMTVEGGKARMQSEPNNYVLVDTDKGSYLYVDLAAKLLVDMGTPPAPPADAPKPPKPKPVQAELVHKGRGPIIAGFPTDHYQLMAEGRICSDTFLSKAALNEAGMKTFLEGFQKLYAKQKAGYRELGTEYAPCDDAQDVAMARYTTLGMAMRTVDVDGFLRQEIVSIRKTKLAPGFFDVPKGFKEITLEQYLRGNEEEEQRAIEEYLKRKQAEEEAEKNKK